MLSSIRSLCLTVVVLLSPLFLSACGHTSLTKTLWAAIPALGEDVDALHTDPRRAYLRISVRGRTALMVLGYRESHPEGEIDTWYSGKGEVIRLQNGRIFSTSGLETDWRAVRNPPLPTWPQLTTRTALATQTTFEYRRERDEMPGYRYGIAESIVLRTIAPPADSKMVGLTPHNFQWFEERVIGQADGYPPTRFAVSIVDGKYQAIYGEHCLSTTLCFAWQSWPVKQPVKL